MPFLIFFVSILFQVLNLEPEINIYDEGIILVGAELINSGKLPYKDFWTMYGPAPFYLTYWLFNIFGHFDFILQGLGIISKSLIALYTYLIIEKFGSKFIASSIAMCSLYVLTLVHNNGFPIFPAIAFCFLSIYIFFFKLDSSPRLKLLLSGLLIGLAITFRHDLGVYAYLSVLLGLTFMAISRRIPKPITLSLPIDYLQYTLGVLAIVIPIVFYFVDNVPLGLLYENLIYIPSVIYPKYRSSSFPNLSSNIFDLLSYLPFLVTFSAAFQIKFAIRNLNEKLLFLFFTLMVLTLFFSIKGIVRVSTLHMSPGISAALILLGIQLSLVNSFILKNGGGKLIFISMIIFVPITLLIGNIKDNILTGSFLSVINSCRNPQLPRLVCVNINPDYLNAAKYIRSRTSNSDLIYVAQNRHDKVFANALSFYFTVELLPATYWHDIHPGIQTEKHFQEQMLIDFKKNEPKYLVLDSRWDAVTEPNASRFSSGNFIVDDYIKANYHLVETYGSVQIFKIK